MFQFEFENRLFTFTVNPQCASLLQLPPQIRNGTEAHP